MKCFHAAVVSLLCLVAPALGQEQPKGQATVKTFAYKKTVLVR
jgi:hypothetical protein